MSVLSSAVLSVVDRDAHAHTRTHVGCESRDAAASYTYNGMVGALAEINSAQEDAFLAQQLGTGWYWLGGRDSSFGQAANAQWQWVRSGALFYQSKTATPSRPLSTPAYSNFFWGEPSSSGNNEHCMTVIYKSTSEYGWNDLVCTAQLWSIIEFQRTPVCVSVCCFSMSFHSGSAFALCLRFRCPAVVIPACS